jgi:hypothetical protein
VKTILALIALASLAAQEAPCIAIITEDSNTTSDLKVYAWTDTAKKKEYLVFVGKEGGNLSITVVPRIPRDPPPPKVSLPAEDPRTATGARP